MADSQTISMAQYEVLAARRQAFDGMLWQTPVLSLTAQAFLFTIALGSGNSPAARAISATLALIAALASLQLMAKHRAHEVEDSELLENFEKHTQGMYVIHGPRSRTRRPFYIKWSSYIVWLFTLWSFTLAAAFVLLAVVEKWQSVF